MDAFGIITRQTQLLSPAATVVLNALRADAVEVYGTSFEPSTPEILLKPARTAPPETSYSSRLEQRPFGVGLLVCMALKSTIYKAELQIADMDRHYYGDHALTIARHPSETDERMMVRVAAFALFAQSGSNSPKGCPTPTSPISGKRI